MLYKVFRVDCQGTSECVKLSKITKKDKAGFSVSTGVSGLRQPAAFRSKGAALGYGNLRHQ